jgi:4-hydroxybenzoate polyprenyltransferase
MKFDVKAWWEISRPKHIPIVSAGSCLALFVLGATNPMTYILAAVVAALMVTGAIIHNDAVDAEVDAIEKPHRPVPSGRISQEAAYLVGMAMMTAGILVSGPLGAGPIFICLGLGLLSLYYNTKAKKDHAFVGNLVVAICVGATLYFPMAIVGVWNLWPQALGFTLVEWSRETYITCQDVEGDRKGGYKTLPVLIGNELSLFVCGLLLLAGMFPMLIVVNPNLGLIYKLTALAFIMCLAIGISWAGIREVDFTKNLPTYTDEVIASEREAITKVYELWGRKIAKNLLLLMIAAMFVDFIV